MPPVIAATARFSREKLLQTARSLPADLQTLAQLGEMLQDINCELDTIADLLRSDAALAVRIVRISNSALFGGAGRTGSIEEAVNRVGFGEILKLVGTATTARLAEQALESYRVSATELRNNMLYVGLTCEALAGPADISARLAYTAGLLRPLGLMVLNRVARGQSGSIPHYASAQWPSYSAWEGSILGVDNCDVASLILEEWRFPPVLSRGIRAQYLAQETDWDCPLAALLNVANGLAVRVNRGLPGEAGSWQLNDKVFRLAGIQESDLAPAIARAEVAFQAAVSALEA